MAEINNVLKKIVFDLSRFFKNNVGICDIHPGLLSGTEVNIIKTQSPVIYTTVLQISENEWMDAGFLKSSAEFTSFLLVYHLDPITRDHLARTLIFQLMHIIYNNQWELPDVYPATDVKGSDLYGLLRSPDKNVGDQGWSPTLQARASDIFGELAPDADPQFSIWYVNWIQPFVQEALGPVLSIDTTVATTVTFPSSLTASIENPPNVTSLALHNWFNETNDNRQHIISGDLIVTPPDNAQEITEYRLYWGKEDHDNPFQKVAKISTLLSTDSLIYKIPHDTIVPREATHILAFSKSPQGMSDQAAATAIYDRWLTGQALAEVRIQATGITTATDIYILGGKNNASQVVATFTAYSSISKNWSDPAPLHSDLTETIGGGAYHDQLLVVGKKLDTTAAIFLYDTINNTWSNTPISVPLDPGKSALSATMMGNQLLVMSNSLSGYSEHMYVYTIKDNIETGTWVSSTSFGSDPDAPPSPSFAFQSFGACHSHDEWFIVGGEEENGAEYLDTIHAYHPTRRTWRTLPNMSVPRKQCSCCVVGRYLFVIGGETTGGSMSTSVERYDLLNDIWTVMTPLPEACSQTATGSLNSNIYVVGGHNGTTGNTDTRIYIVG